MRKRNWWNLSLKWLAAIKQKTVLYVILRWILKVTKKYKLPGDMVGFVFWISLETAVYS